jgi:hypothetical protein
MQVTPGGSLANTLAGISRLAAYGGCAPLSVGLCCGPVRPRVGSLNALLMRGLNNAGVAVLPDNEQQQQPQQQRCGNGDNDSCSGTGTVPPDRGGLPATPA